MSNNIIWLVVLTILKHKKVNGKDDIPYIMENKIHVWNHQPVHIVNVELYVYICIYIHRTNWLWTGVDLVYNWWLGCNQPIQGMWWDIAGEERWQGQFTPIKCIWVKVGIRKIQWSPTNDDRPWTSTTHMASLTSQRGAQCRINGKPAWNLVPHSGFFLS